MLCALFAVLAVAAAGCTRPAPEPSPAPPVQPPTEPTRIVVGVDELGPGFNPHLLAHQGTVTTALATLVLPSVFRPTADGTWELDPAVATSATVTSTEPFTVTYELSLEASWSSNAPVAAEDFVYLWERMRSEPGTVDAAGYRLITEIRSRAAGKTVEVVFAEPYPQWRELFSNLLPAHILKDAPGSWVGALTGGLPASGGPYRIATVDRARGEILLVRNDRYWAEPTVLDELVLRSLDAPAMAASIANGDIDIALPRADSDIRAALAGLVPPPQVQTAPAPVVTQLALRADDGPLADVRARQALAALLDREAIRAEVAPDALAANAFGRAPSEHGYTPTGPSGPDPARAERLLTDAGWMKASDGRWRRGDEPVELVIGAAAERPEDLRTARAVAAQLEAAGIGTDVVVAPGDELYTRPSVTATPPTTTASPSPSRTSSQAANGTVTRDHTGVADPVTTASAPTPSSTAHPTTSPQPLPGLEPLARADLLVVPVPVASEPSVTLASAYGCPPRSAQVPNPPRLATGFCFPALNLLLDELLTAGFDAETEAVVERVLWQQVPALPLFQPVTLVVSTSAAAAATGVGPGPLRTGPLTGAERWTEPAD